jgi:predicted dehydrogenase
MISMKKLRVAVIGLGKMGLLHAGLLGSMNDVELVALCDQKKLLLRIAKKVFKEKITVVNNIQALANLNLDAVYVTTPIPTHYRVIDSIYDGNIARNIFVEKTLSWHADESNKLCQKAKESNGANMVGYQKRYSVTFVKAFKLLKDQAIGDLTNFKAYAYSSDFLGVKREDAFKIFASRGGVLRDLGSHAISLALWYFGDLRSVVPDDKSDAGPNYGETVSFQSKAGNLEGSIEASWCKEGYRMPEIGVLIEGDKGNLIVNDDKVFVKFKNGSSQELFRQDLDDSVNFVLWSPEYYREDRNFVECALNGYIPNPNFFEGAKVDQIIESVTRNLC